MITRIATLILMLASFAPAWADEPKKSEDKDKKEAPKSLETASVDDEDQKPDPIRRLAEMQIDEFVVPARAINLPLPGRTKTLQEVIDRFSDWSKDKNIGAVLLDVGDVSLSLADVQELRTGIERMRKADKKVFAFVNGGDPQAYLLACAADEIVLAPTGSIAIPGLGALFPFMKGHFQMLGLEFDVITAGKYKYPGFVNQREPNDCFREEFNTILDSWFDDYRDIIAKSRHLSKDAVSQAVDVALFNATQAKQRGLVDTLAYYDEYLERVLRREKMKRFKDSERGLADVHSLQDFMELINDELKKSEEARKAVGPKIAVLHARGPIIDVNLGIGMASQLICRDDFAKVVDELRKNNSIKAVVMRVDSPGGSGYASDVIWTHLKRLGETKPLVVSMGAVAGSGGYYIACPGQRIFAQPTTLTGSIGVIGMLQCAWSAFNRADYVLAPMQRGARSLLGSPHRSLSVEDRAFIQKYIDDFYGVFIDRVATCRKMPAEEVRKIAEGRIYTGRQALALGLVDELGGLPEAIEAARTLANIPPSAELKIVHYPRPGSLGEIFESFSGVGVTQALDALVRGSAAAAPVTFEQQVALFSAMRPQALCWMAIPDFYQPRRAFGTGLLQNRSDAGVDPMTRLLQRP